MNKVEVGQKVVAVWGAMYPQVECVIEEVCPDGYVFIRDIMEEDGTAYIVDGANIKEQPEVGMPVGVYFA